MKYTLADIFREIYDYHKKYYAYIFDWPWYSYRKYKAIFYFNTAAILTHLFLKTPISPNGITAIYLLTGIIGGVLIAAPSKALVMTGLVIFFLRPSLDSCDGLVARLKGQTSSAGEVLDPYASDVGWVFLWSGVGIYLGNYTNHLFYCFSPVVPLFFALSYDFYYILKVTHTRTSVCGPKSAGVAGEQAKGDDAANIPTSFSRLGKFKSLVDEIFEFNARTVDLLLLLIAIELFSNLRIVWIYFTGMIVWQITVFFTRVYLAARSGWIEKEFTEAGTIASKNL